MDKNNNNIDDVLETKIQMIYGFGCLGLAIFGTITQSFGGTAVVTLCAIGATLLGARGIINKVV